LVAAAHSFGHANPFERTQVNQVVRTTIARTTFVIDGKGRISAIFHKVKPDAHIDLVQSALATLIKK
jgi:peroxiredoxin